jgi:DNA polymerase III subunit chi
MATTITFYQILSETKEKSLCQLLAKVYNSGSKALVKFKDSDYLEQINRTLWSFSQKEFIPHGSHADPLSERQPIYLTTGDENPNNANLIVQVGQGEVEIKNFERALLVFDGSNNEELAFARQKYKFYKDQNYTLEYWQQSASGAWEKVV